jgi:hypothetical protein
MVSPSLMAITFPVISFEWKEAVMNRLIIMAGRSLRYRVCIIKLTIIMAKLVHSKLVESRTGL